jgi:hypothetical protein
MDPCDGRSFEEQAVVEVLADTRGATTHDLVRQTGLSLRAVLVALRGMLQRGEVVELSSARYALDEVCDGPENAGDNDRRADCRAPDDARRARA